MSVLLLFVVGAIVAVAGLGAIGYGIPVREFSFGNTLIVAGTIAVAGGLIVIGIGAVVGHLRRIGEMLAARPSAGADSSHETFEPPASAYAPPPPGRIPFPSRPQPAAVREPPPPMPPAMPPPMQPPAPPAAPVEDHPAAAAAPMLQNPDRPAVAVEELEVAETEHVSLSPQQPVPPPAPVNQHELAPPPPPPPPRNNISAPPIAEPEFEVPAWLSAPPPPAPPPPPRAPQTTNFDAMWPSEPRPVKRPVVEEPKPEPKPELAPPPAPEPPSEPVAILKSGVVDGMGYTLYVDGSIEAELPQGTLRFASINELRDHLAKS
jgi:hypothetical protein